MRHLGLFLPCFIPNSTLPILQALALTPNLDGEKTQV